MVKKTKSKARNPHKSAIIPSGETSIVGAGARELGRKQLTPGIYTAKSQREKAFSVPASEVRNLHLYDMPLRTLQRLEGVHKPALGSLSFEVVKLMYPQARVGKSKYSCKV